mmetsp:Transcript_24753/g.40568  ORF Transcript_24753/g.40568 Transcript_24753/m.40568 type:complete len:340 (-) Transcript_24753:704-1723(-)
MISIGNAAALLLAVAANTHGFTVKEPPMPFKWPVVGTLPDFFARGGVDSLCEIYEDMYAEYGNVYGMSMMGNDKLIVSDPYVFDTVLRNEGKFPIGGSESVSTFVDYYNENNLTMAMKSSSRGADWQEWRQSLNPDMYARWESYLPAIADAASKISKVAGYEVTEQKNIAFVDYISRAAFDMFSAVMFGESPQTTDSTVAVPEDIEFVKATQAAFDLTGVVMTNPLEKVFKSDVYESFKVNMDKTYSFGNKKTVEYVEQAYKLQEEDVQEGEDSKCPVQGIKDNIQTNFLNPSFVERLVNRGQLSQDDISELSPSLLMAGVDTTAYVLSWFFSQHSIQS